jgi:tetratricopeptide (TPR) repeat protein
MEDDLYSLIDKGEKALTRGETLVALMLFEAAIELRPLPVAQSALAYCLAKERRQFPRAFALCREALGADPTDPRHYYHLGRIHLLANQKPQAIMSFRRGIKIKRYQPIIDEMRRLGLRKPPVFNSLPRDHFLNRSLGLLFSRLGTR